MYLKHTGRVVLAAIAGTLFLGTVAVILRIIAKRKARQSFAVEDGLIISALAICYANAAVVLHGVWLAGGTLDPFEFVSLEGFEAFLKALYVAEILMGLSITLVKLSILLWYRRIFSVKRTQIVINVIGCLCIAWFITVTFVIIFQCTPVNLAWDLAALLLDRCISLWDIILGYEISNIILDIMILCVPLAHMRKLQMSLHIKVAVSGLFLLGGFVCIASVLRLVYTYDPDNHVNVKPYDTILWAVIELCAAVVSACLPMYRPLFSSSLKFGSQRTWVVDRSSHEQTSASSTRFLRDRSFTGSSNPAMSSNQSALTATEFV